MYFEKEWCFVRRRFLLLGLFLVFLGGWGSLASAQFKLSAQLGYDSISYREYTNGGSSTTELKGWSTRLKGSYGREDLLFTGLYQGSRSLNEQRLKQNWGQISANYLIFQEDLLRVYGGLGFQFFQAEGPPLAGDLKGSGFVGQMIMALDLSPELEASVALSGTPWSRWQVGEGQSAGGGSSFHYHLDLSYDFKEEYGLQLGLTGANQKVDQPRVSLANTGINLGVVWRF